MIEKLHILTETTYALTTKYIFLSSQDNYYSCPNLKMKAYLFKEEFTTLKSLSLAELPFDFSEYDGIYIYTQG